MLVLEGLDVEENGVFPRRGEQLWVCGHRRVLVAARGWLQKMKKRVLPGRCCMWAVGSLVRTALLWLAVKTNLEESEGLSWLVYLLA